MPEGKWFNEKNLQQALANKEINMSHIDQASHLTIPLNASPELP